MGQNAIYYKGKSYSGGGGGSGTEVIPNPQDTPTDTLDSVKIGDATYEIQGGGGGGSSMILDAQRYSLDEQVVGIWTDGKPLYQKTFYFTTPVQVQANRYETLVTSSGLSIETIVSGEALPSKEATFAPISLTYTQSGDIQGYFPTAWSISYLTIRYTKTTDTAGSGGFQAYGFTPLIYSEEEREVGVWKDNKPLYQKTIDIGALPNNNQKLVNHNISDFGEAVRVFGYARNTSNNAIIPLPHNHPNAANQSVSLIVTTTQISVQTGNDRSGYVGYVTVQYTKASDTAGSGEYNTLAIPNVHYSTDEQVIGTWIDGKTLYQKTFTGTLGGSTGDDVSNYKMADLSNIDVIVDISGTLEGITPINSYYSSSNYNMVFVGSAKTGLYCNGKNVGGNTYKVTLQYTKTTDA